EVGGEPIAARIHRFALDGEHRAPLCEREAMPQRISSACLTPLRAAGPPAASRSNCRSPARPPPAPRRSAARSRSATGPPSGSWCGRTPGDVPERNTPRRGAAWAASRLEVILAHACMVRNFLEHADEVQEDEEMLEVHRLIFSDFRNDAPTGQ